MTLSEFLRTRFGFFTLEEVIERDLMIVHLSQMVADHRRLSVGIAQAYVDLARQFRAHLDDDHDLIGPLDELIQGAADRLSQMEEFAP